MFDSIGWGEILVLAVAGLFILGPERLPAAAAWAGKAIRQVRDYAAGAREQLREEIGPEFDELRKPLNELRGLRGTISGFDPRRAVTRTLFDDDTPPSAGSAGSGEGAVKPNGYTPNQPNGTRPVDPLVPGERPPIDPDAT